jgi:hypothetical protein
MQVYSLGSDSSDGESRRKVTGMAMPKLVQMVEVAMRDGNHKCWLAGYRSKCDDGWSIDEC